MLLSLPEELLTLILEHLAVPGQIWSKATDWPHKDIIPEHLTSLSNVSSVSKSLHRLAWPLLYRSFTNGEPRIFHGAGVNVDKLPQHLFLRTICLKPEYALAARSLAIVSSSKYRGVEDSESFDLLPGDTLAALFRWKAKQIWYGEYDHYDKLASAYYMHNEIPTFDSISSSLLQSMETPEAQMALLLLLCPNLKELEILAPSLRGNYILDKLLKAILEAALSENYQTAEIPLPTYDLEQDESDYIMTQTLGTPRSRKLPTLQNLEKLALSSSSMPASGMASFKNLLATLLSLRTLDVDHLDGGHRNVTINSRPSAASA